MFFRDEFNEHFIKRRNNSSKNCEFKYASEFGISNIYLKTLGCAFLNSRTEYFFAISKQTNNDKIVMHIKANDF